MKYFLYLTGLALLIVGCGKEGITSSHFHEARAPHGGTAQPLGEDHQLEWVQDTNAGRLDVYILDDDMDNFIRIKAPKLELAVGNETLTLLPIASSATGETVGDTSQFQASASWLKTNASWEGTLQAVDVNGEKFLHVPVRMGMGDVTAAK